MSNWGGGSHIYSGKPSGKYVCLAYYVRPARELFLVTFCVHCGTAREFGSQRGCFAVFVMCYLLFLTSGISSSVLYYIFIVNNLIWLSSHVVLESPASLA